MKIPGGGGTIVKTLNGMENPGEWGGGLMAKMPCGGGYSLEPNSRQQLVKYTVILYNKISIYFTPPDLSD